MDTTAARAALHYAERHAAGDRPDYEMLLESAYMRLIESGQTVFDIGAHSGRHTRQFVKAVGLWGKVRAFEPLPHKAAELMQAFRWRPGVKVVQKALSNRPQAGAVFKYAVNAPEESGLRERIYNVADPGLTSISVDVSTLDIEAGSASRVDYIKIDVEGAEIDCLNGGRETIRRCRPIISVEYGKPAYSVYGNSAATLFELAARQGYVLFDLFGNGITSLGEWIYICDRAYWDYFLVPTERVAWFEARLTQPR